MRPKGSHGHLLEEGTTLRHYFTKKGKLHNTGKGPATYFFENAYNATEEPSKQEIVDEIFRVVAEQVEKAKRKLKK